MQAPKPQSVEEDFSLSTEPQEAYFELELSPNAELPVQNAQQPELYLPVENPEQPDASPQRSFVEMQPPCYQVTLVGAEHSTHFQYAQNLLESLESQQVDINYQCREGYCGSCRVRLLQGKVHYLCEPMAWLNEDEILTCCSIPKTDITIHIPGQ